ncbi:MAG: HTTM domain-containing protein [Roseivirga sp.]|nr:HTTM domain-containing protein [Roseivirga sp.]
MFGGIMFWEVTRYFKYDWIERYWIAPRFNFSYWPFNFQPLPGDGMYIVWGALGVLALFIFLGFLYRISTVLFFLLFSYTYLLEQARYLNHFYLVILVSLVLIFLPAHRGFSIDSVIFKKKSTDYAPAWSLWLVRFLIGVPYFFGGIAKINPDWLRGYPLKRWLLGDVDFPLIGKYFTEEWMIMIMSYSGLILDLAVVPILLFKRTRKWGFVIICIFHLMNAQLFSIGIFPWFMIASTTLFFPPDWPRPLLSKAGLNEADTPLKGLQSFSLPGAKKQKLILWSLALFVGIQILLPFRHLVIPGNVHWTEEGHRYAWHMKLRSKSGNTAFYIKNKESGITSLVNTRAYLTSWQEDKMAGKPYMIWEFAQHLKEEHDKLGIEIEVYVNAFASLNGRQYQEIINPETDLASVPKPVFGSAPWIIPLTTPLKNQR